VGRLTPSPLVVVRRYRLPAMEGLSSVSAEDRLVLLQAGIEAYVKNDQFGEVLLVPEKQVVTAQEVLGASPPELFPEKPVPACPRCHASHPDPCFPYQLAIVAVGLAIGVAVAGLGHPFFGLAAVTIGVVTAGTAKSRFPRWRCASCGERYGAVTETIRTD
jgi:hypothetical protein